MRNKLIGSTALPPSLTSDPAPPAGIGRNQPPDDALLTAKEAAGLVNLSIAAFWRNVCNRRLPEPVYPALRAPRWWRSRLLAAVNATQAHPTDNKIARRKAKLARQRAEACHKAKLERLRANEKAANPAT